LRYCIKNNGWKHQDAQKLIIVHNKCVCSIEADCLYLVRRCAKLYGNTNLLNKSLRKRKKKKKKSSDFASVEDVTDNWSH